MRDLHQKTMPCLPIEQMYAIYVRSLISAKMFSIAKDFLSYLFGVSQPSTTGPASPLQSANLFTGLDISAVASVQSLLLEEAKQFFNSAPHATDEALDLATQCLNLLNETLESSAQPETQTEAKAAVLAEVRSELDLILAVRQLTLLGVDIVPLELRFASPPAKLQILRRVVARDVSAFCSDVAFPRLCELGRLIGFTSPRDMCEIQLMLVSVALDHQYFNFAFDCCCKLLDDHRYRPAWAAAQRIVSSFEMKTKANTATPREEFSRSVLDVLRGTAAPEQPLSQHSLDYLMGHTLWSCEPTHINTALMHWKSAQVLKTGSSVTSPPVLV
jgi:hypothetical protein